MVFAFFRFDAISTYKAHVATDAHGLITDDVYDTACVHDSQPMDDLLQNEKLAVFGDSAESHEVKA